ncbi:hypothetical protein CJ026_026035, partial [Ralstonia pickettii]
MCIDHKQSLFSKDACRQPGITGHEWQGGRDGSVVRQMTDAVGTELSGQAVELAHRWVREAAAAD